MRGARTSSPAPVVVSGRGDTDGRRSSRRPIRAATTAARAPQGALPLLAKGKVGGRNALVGGAHRPWRAAAAAATTGCFFRRGAEARRRRCKILGPLRRRRRIKRGPIGGGVSAGARRASSPVPVVVGGRGDADGERSSRCPIRAATTAARAPPDALSPWRRGKSGAAAPSAWGRAAPGGRWWRRQRRGASACAVRWCRRIEYGALGGRPALGAGRGFLVFSVAGGQCPPSSSGGGCHRRCRMPSAFTCALRDRLFPWATRPWEGAPCAAVFRVSRTARRCAIGGLRRAPRTPQSQTGDMQYYSRGTVLVAVGAGARKPAGRWCVAFVACRCGL